MGLFEQLRWWLLVAWTCCAASANPSYDITDAASPQQHVLQGHSGVSDSLFAELERLARLVDIAYCVGTTGISPPFSCVSRCADFPTAKLVTAWNTGVLLTDSCGYVAVDHDPAAAAIVVAFRGTYSITNTVVDLSTVPQEYVPYPDPEDEDGVGDGDGNGGGPSAPRERCNNCTVHMGFLTSWRSARSLVLPAVRRAKQAHPSYPVHLVGHSLGGAVAALAALELRLVEGWDDVVVTTFGEPRVGNEGLAEFIDKIFDLGGQEAEEGEEEQERGAPKEARAFRRVTHAGDPVPLLPPSEWGYWAHAGEIYIEKEALPPSPTDLRLCRGARDLACSDPADGSARRLLLRLLHDFGTFHDFGKATTGAQDPKSPTPVRDDDHDGGEAAAGPRRFPTRLKLWQLFFAHRDYFWRLGLCVPGGDPADWGRDKYNLSPPSRQDEL